MSIRMRMALASVLVMAATACGGYDSPAAPSPTNASATIASGAFTPASIDIPAGSTVTWTNQDTTAHGVVADNGAFNSGTIAPGGAFSHMFPAAGTFTYHDSANANMVGTVNVSASSSTPNPY